MQRLANLVPRAAKPAFVVGTGIASTSTAQCRAPAPQKATLEHSPPHSPTTQSRSLSVEEGLDGWDYVKNDEVSAALNDLAVLGGLRRSPSPPASREMATVVYRSAASTAASDEDESITTEGSEANRMLSRADTVDALFGRVPGYEEGEESADPMENLSMVVGNLLNNPAVVGSIQQALVQDPHFYALMRQVNPSLPCPAHPLLITEITSDWASDVGEDAPLDEGDGEGEGGPPLGALLHSMQRGVARLAVHVAEAFSHLGNFLRRLGDNLKTSLEGLPGVEAEVADEHAAAQAAHKWQSALVKVACAVLVVVMAKRVRAFA